MVNEGVVGIIGTGVMGRGIAQILAQSGRTVLLYDNQAGAAQIARRELRKTFEFLVRKEKLAADQADKAIERLQPVRSLDELRDCSLLVEAIVEAEKPKKDLYTSLELIVSTDCIIATNTSSFSIAKLAADLNHKSRFIGLHFFHPVPRMKVVEVIPWAGTSADVTEMCNDIITSTGHQVIRARDYPGFIVNHAGRAFVTEGLMILEERVCEAPVLDEIIRKCLGFKMGPAELLDLTGLDVSVPAMEQIYSGFQFDPILRPTAFGAHRLNAGVLGRKTNRGFYHYADGKKAVETTELKPGPQPSVYICESPWLKSAMNWFESASIEIVSEANADLLIVCPLGTDVSAEVEARQIDPSRAVGFDALFSKSDYGVFATTPASSVDTVSYANALVGKIGGARIGDSHGMICQRIMATIVNLTCSIAQKKIATPHDIELGVKLGLGYPTGPFEMGNRIGPSVVRSILEGMFEVTKDPRYRPVPWLRRRAALGVSMEKIEL